MNKLLPKTVYLRGSKETVETAIARKKKLARLKKLWSAESESHVWRMLIDGVDA